MVEFDAEVVVAGALAGAGGIGFEVDTDGVPGAAGGVVDGLAAGAAAEVKDGFAGEVVVAVEGLEDDVAGADGVSEGGGGVLDELVEVGIAGGEGAIEPVDEALGAGGWCGGCGFELGAELGGLCGGREERVCAQRSRCAVVWFGRR